MPRDNILPNLRRRLERWELAHLRQLAADLQQRLETAEAERDQADACAEMWQHNYELLQSMHDDDEVSTHRCIGINTSGEMMVVKTEVHHAA